VDFKNFTLSKKLLRKYFFIPVLLLLLSILFMGISYSKNGAILQKGIDFEGGVQVTVHYSEEIDNADFKATLSRDLGVTDVDVVTTTDPTTRRQETIVVSIGGDVEESEITSAIGNYLDIELKPTEYSISVLGPAMASTFWSQAVWAFVFAFLFMAGVVVVTYRKLLPSVAIIISAAYDLTIIIGFMAFFKINLSLATIAALLMVIGYGVDTNILLTNKIFRKTSEDVYERLTKGLRTGLTMSATTIAILLALFLVGGAFSLVLKQISGILLIGLIADIPNTWLLNANILTWKLD